MPKSLSNFMTAAYTRGCEASILEIAELLNIPLTEHLFEVSLSVEKQLETYGLVLIPPLPKGNETSVRLVCCPSREMTADQVLQEIQEDEGWTVEFKSTFVYDVDRANAGTFNQIRELRSEGVMHSSLKTIAALMNTEGGVLYVGVDNSRNVCGIEPDFQLLSEGKQNLDGWELEFRQQIKSKFFDGVTVNNYVRISFVAHGEQTVARVQITPRHRPTYLKAKKGEGYEVYVRQGNESNPLDYPAFEEFLRARLG